MNDGNVFHTIQEAGSPKSGKNGQGRAVFKTADFQLCPHTGEKASSLESPL